MLRAAMSAPSVLTVTPNPAIDQTVLLDTLRPGEVNRCSELHHQAGGKGVNVSAMLGAYGIRSTATGFLGGENPSLFEEMFARLGIADAFIRLPGFTRTGIKIVTRGDTTDLNSPGLRPSASDLTRLRETIRRHSAPGGWIVFGGRLPDGISAADFSSLLEAARQQEARIAVDTSGQALRVAIDHGVDLIKPNHRELGEILGRNLPDAASRLDAALEMRAAGVAHVILSQGADGALFLAPDGRISATPPPVSARGTVGAGDSLLAGYLAGLVEKMPLADRARLASVFAWSALENIDRQGPGRSLAEKRMKRIALKEVLPS